MAGTQDQSCPTELGFAMAFDPAQTFTSDSSWPTEMGFQIAFDPAADPGGGPPPVSVATGSLGLMGVGV